MCRQVAPPPPLLPCHLERRPVPAYRSVCRLVTFPPSLVPCQTVRRPVPVHCSICRQVSHSRSFSAWASPSVSLGVTASNPAILLAQAPTSAYAPPRVLPTDNSSISGTMSASVSTSHCSLLSVSPSVTQQVIKCVRIVRFVARWHRLHLCLPFSPGVDQCLRTTRCVAY